MKTSSKVMIAGGVVLAASSVAWVNNAFNPPVRESVASIGELSVFALLVGVGLAIAGK